MEVSPERGTCVRSTVFSARQILLPSPLVFLLSLECLWTCGQLYVAGHISSKKHQSKKQFPQRQDTKCLWLVSRMSFNSSRGWGLTEGGNSGVNQLGPISYNPSRGLSASLPSRGEALVYTSERQANPAGFRTFLSTGTWKGGAGTGWSVLL